MTLPYLIWEEVISFLTPSELYKLLTLNRTLQPIILNTFSSSLTPRQILPFVKKFPDRLHLIRIAKVNNDKQVRAILGASRLESLVTDWKYFSYKELSCFLFHPNLRNLDLNRCQIDIGITKLINSLPNLRKLYLPSFVSRQLKLPRYLSRIKNPSLKELSLTMDYLDYEIISLLNYTELTHLSLEAFDIKGPDRILSLPFLKLNHLKLQVHKYQLQPILIDPVNFPHLKQLSSTTKYAIILPEPKFTTDTFFKKYQNFGLEKELCLTYSYRGLNLTTLHLETDQLDIRTVVYTLKWKSQLSKLSLINLNINQLEQELNLNNSTTTHPTLLQLHLTTTTELTLNLLSWLPRTFPNLQTLHLGSTITTNLPTKPSYSFPSLFILKLSEGIIPLPLLKSIIAPSLSFLHLQVTSLPQPSTLKSLHKLYPQLHLTFLPPSPNPNPNPIPHTHPTPHHPSSHHLDHYEIYGNIKGHYHIDTYGYRNQSVRMLPSTTYSRL